MPTSKWFNSDCLAAILDTDPKKLFGDMSQNAPLSVP